MDEALKQVGEHRKKEANGLYLQAQRLVQSGNYVEAWGVIDTALELMQNSYCCDHGDLTEKLVELKSGLPKIF